MDSPASPDDRRFYVYVANHPVSGAPIYVGKGHGRRKNQHNGDAMAGRHVNPILQAVIRKYGPLEFVEVEAGLTEPEAFERERALIARYGRINTKTGTLANLTDGGDGASGYKHSAKWIAETVARNKARITTPEARARMSAANRGRPVKAETRAKIAAIHKGRKRSPESIARSAAAQRGRSYSVEARAKMSAARKGKKHSADHKTKIGASLAGRTHTPESKANMRAGILRVVESKRVYHADLFAWADAREAKRRDDRQAATERERIRRAAARQKVAAQQDAEAGQDARPCPSLLRQLALNGVAPMLSRIAPGPQRLPNAP